MTKTLEFYFDFGSPTAYLAHTQMRSIAERTAADVIYRPMLLGGVFKATGNASPIGVPAKARYLEADMIRCANRLDVPFALNPAFPINTVYLMRGAVALRGDSAFERYVENVYGAIWVESKNMGDPQVVASVLAGIGFEPEAFLARIAEDEVKAKLKTDTEQAVARGVFGAPTFFVGDQMFFGHDRLDFVESALT